MLVKINKRGKGNSRSAVNYLMGDYGTIKCPKTGKSRMPTASEREQGIGLRSVKPTVIRGDVEQTAQLIDSLNFARNYTSGCLSFEEENITDSQKQKIMDSFERAIFTGLDADQYDVTWIEHRDKGRLELNFLIPNVELTSGKRLQPYYDQADRTRINAWQTMVNGVYDFADPHDPARARAMCYSSDLPKDRNEAMRKITNGLLSLAEQGQISNRQDVIDTLSGHGFAVTRTTKTSISISIEGSKKPLRLKGDLYERDFKFSKEIRADREQSITDYRSQRKQRVQEARRTYQEASSTKRKEHKQRYSRPEPPKPRAVEQSPISHTGTVQHGNNNGRLTDGINIDSRKQIRLDKHNNWMKNNERNIKTTSTITATITATIRSALQRIADAIRTDSRTSHSDYRQYQRTRQRQQQPENGREWRNTMRPM